MVVKIRLRQKSMDHPLTKGIGKNQCRDLSEKNSIWRACYVELDRRAGTVGISWKNEERFIVALDQGLRVVGERSQETGNLQSTECQMGWQQTHNLFHENDK